MNNINTTMKMSDRHDSSGSIHGTHDAILRAGAGSLLLLALALSVLLACPAGAQEDEGTGAFVSTGFETIGKADLEDDQGKIGSSTFMVATGFEWLSLGYERQSFSFDDVDKIPFGNGDEDPWGTLHAITLSSDHFDMIDEEWGWFAGASISTAYEDEQGDSWSGMVHGGAIYAWSEHTTIQFGLATGVDGLGMDIMPLLGIEWDYIGEDGAGWFAGLGMPETHVGYAFSNEFSLALELGMDGSLHRLADDSTVSQKGYLEQSGATAALAATWSPLENLSVILAPTYHFSQSMTTYDKDGDKIDSYDLDDAAGAYLGVSLAF